MPECECGCHVSERYAAVMGDRDDVVHACVQCATATAVRAGAGAGLETRDPIEFIPRGRRTDAQQRRVVESDD